MSADNDLSGIFENIAEENSIEITSVKALGGGDINEVFLLSTTGADNFVVKINDALEFPGMFESEKEGLETLAKTDCIKIPKPLNTGEFDGKAYLLMEHIPAGKQGNDFWEDFGVQLASLHKHTNKEFGFHQDNYVGSLSQKNTWNPSAVDFYITRRLAPQLKLAEENKYDLGVSKYFIRNVSENIPDEPPALIHGDLWNGNLIITSSGKPCLIDPAVSYAPREMDLAMMKLFGGFDHRLFSAYKEEFPLERGFEERIPLWQLYYLLVHLNIFGKGYLNQVNNIIRQYN
ncbi:MAG: fructosamine kinase family protein [Gillisia sp.]